MKSQIHPGKKYKINLKSWQIPVPKVSKVAASRWDWILGRGQNSRHRKQLEERQHKTTVDSPQQMAGNVCRFFTKIKELIIWSWSYLWALWFLLVLSVVYYLRGPLKITDNIGMGECSARLAVLPSERAFFTLPYIAGFVSMCSQYVCRAVPLEVIIRGCAMWRGV